MLEVDLELNWKRNKKGDKKKNLMATYSSNQVKMNAYVDEKIVCTLVQKEVNLSSLQQKEKNEKTRIFHIKLKVKNKNIDA